MDATARANRARWRLSGNFFFAPPVHPLSPQVWPLWQRIGFRFVAIFLPLLIVPDLLSDWISPLGTAMDAAVQAANAHLFHVRPMLVQPNGSGDTSWAWTRLWLYLLLAIVGTIAWSVTDARRAAYPRAAYWLRTLLRYQLASAAMTYGIIKLFALQMLFPLPSQLATPLGDLLPMRFSWLFIGYSTPYQVFCGVMELLAGLLLLPRRTVTLGLILGAAAFTNVLLINLAYDVPVKLYSGQLLITCVVLLLMDAPRLVRGLVLNQSVPPCTLYEPPSNSTRTRAARLCAKLVIIVMILVLPFRDSLKRAQDSAQRAVAIPLPAGVYEVRRFVLKGDTIPALAADTVRWRDLIIDNARGGSVGSTDTLFWQRYRRGYFRFHADPATHTLAVWRTSMLQDSTPVLTARYAVHDSTSASLWTRLRGDSLYVELVRSPRHFQLAERQFHWVSEYNR